MKKSAYQIWKESKEQNLTKEEFKEKLKSEGVIVPIEQKRVQLNHGTARVDINCPQKTIDTLNEIVDKAYNMELNYKNEKVSFAVHCQCGCRIMNDEMIKKFDKYYCPKCNRLITSIGGKSTYENDK